MDQEINVSLANSSKPSKLLALIALAIAFALPFILVKSFSHKRKHNTSRNNPITVSLPSVIAKIPSSSFKQKITKPTVPLLQQTAKNNKTPPAIPQLKKEGWQIIKTRPGDSLAIVFKRLGLTPQALQSIIHDTSRAKLLSHLHTNEKLEFLIKNNLLERMRLPISNTQYLELYRVGHHYKSKINTRKMNAKNLILTATVRGSLFSTAKRNNIPFKLIRQMIEVFTWDINFAKDVRIGDRFSIVYKAFYINNKLVSTGDILAVNYVNRGRTFQAIRYTSKNGYSAYYSPQGRSLKKAFDRYPLRFSHISSPFSSSRYHPILHYRRGHKGIDLAAPIGTPIHATGDGRISLIGRHSGYGNMIKINHQQYSTIYGHMLKFQKGLSRGDFVRRGQVIGYVGQTGLASGPHCHYEFHINRRPQNPTTVTLPRGFPIPFREMAVFKLNAATLLAQLKLFEKKHTALS